MKSLTISTDNTTDYITIPNYFLDLYMPEANGEFVKIYLYLIRCISDSEIELSVSFLADKFNHTENDVNRALRYWEKVGLLSLSYDLQTKELSGILLHTPEAQLKERNDSLAGTAHKLSQSQDFVLNSGFVTNNHSATSEEEEHSVIVETAPEHPIKPSYTPSQLKQLTEKEDLCQLLYIAQKYLGKTLSASETNTIIYFYESLQFPSDLIEYLIEYCVSREHKSMRYMEKVALSWAEAGISSVSQAKKENTQHNASTYSVMKAFGISNRNPGIREQEFIQKWNDIYCFDSEIIVEACNRTIQTTHQPSFEYADSILSKWKENNITRLSELKALDEQFALKKNKDRLSAAKTHEKGSKQGKSNSSNKFNNFPQRNYDYDELEKQLIGNNN